MLLFQVSLLAVHAAAPVSASSLAEPRRATEPPLADDHVASVGISAPVHAPPASVVGGILLFSTGDPGVEDVLGVFQEAPPGRATWLGAVRAADGRVLWRREASQGQDEALRAIVRDTLLVVTSRGEVAAYDPRSGNPLWNAAIGAAVTGVCAGSGDDVGFRIGSGAVVRAALATGSILAAATPASCVDAYTSKSDGANFTVVEGDKAAAIGGGGASNMTFGRALVPRMGTARVLLGTDRTSRAPVVAAVAAGKLLWRAWVPVHPGNPGDVALVGSGRATVRRDRVIVPYLVKGERELSLACFDLTSGRRQWDEQVPGDSDDFGELAISQNDSLFVRMGTRLWSFNLKSGSRNLVIGDR